MGGESSHADESGRGRGHGHEHEHEHEHENEQDHDSTDDDDGHDCHVLAQSEMVNVNGGRVRGATLGIEKLGDADDLLPLGLVLARAYTI